MFWLTKFGTKDIPLCNAVQDVGAGPIYTTVTQLPGGYHFDAQGNEQSPIKTPYPLKAEAVLHSNSPWELDDMLQQWRALQGTKATLYRRRDRKNLDEYVTARLTEVSARRDIRDRLRLDLSLSFDIFTPVWHGLAHTETITMDASPKTQEIPNNGDSVQRYITITVNATVNPITAIKIENLEAGHVSSFTWTDSIAAGQALVITNRPRAVLNNGVNAYAYFALDAGHTINDWFRLMPGNNTVRVTMTGGSATSTVVFTYNDALA